MILGLRTKLLIPILLTISMGILLAVSFAYMGSSRAISNEVSRSLDREVRLAVKLMDRSILERKRDLAAWSRRQVFVESLTEKGYYGRSARKGARESLVQLVKGYPAYESLFLADPEGRPVATSYPEGAAHLQIDDRAYFREAIAGKAKVSGLITSRKTGDRIFVIAVPVWRGAKICGVLGGAIKLSAFSALFVEEFRQGEAGFAFLTGPEGRVIATSDGPKTGLTDIGRFPFGREILEKPSGSLSFALGGVTRRASFKRLASVPWVFVETQSLGEAFAASRETAQDGILLGIAILLAVSLTISFLFRKMIHRRLSEMQKVIGRVEQGDLTVHMEEEGNPDEIGVLITAFNTMTSRLRRTLGELTWEIQVRKKAEEALAAHRHNLEAQVRERTLQLEQEIEEHRKAEAARKTLEERLLRAEKMEAIGTLAGGVAHDLNNILSGIVSYPELLLMQLPEESPLEKPLGTIRDSGKRAAAIVQDLLTLARRGVSTTEVVDLTTIVRDYRKSPEHEKLLSHHLRVEMEYRLSDPLPHILGSPVHLSKSVMNLVSNAAESMPEGGTITLCTEKRFLDRPPDGYERVTTGDYVALTVADQGVGIAPEDRERIFEPFYTRKKMGRSGTGLGMAVVWGTVEDHNGYILLESCRAKGSTFTLLFPVTSEKPEKRPNVNALEAYQGNGESILVVDDNREQREIAAMILTELGYAVETVSSGEASLEYLACRPVDLLLLDMVMEPGMDGLATYRQVIATRPGQRAVIASGFSESDRVQRAQALGAGGYVKKPYDIQTIGAAVQMALRS